MKREALVSRLRRYARKNGLTFRLDSSKGKGSHVTVTVGDRFTLVQHGELDPFKIKRICGQLGIDPASL